MATVKQTTAEYLRELADTFAAIATEGYQSSGCDPAELFAGEERTIARRLRLAAKKLESK